MSEALDQLQRSSRDVVRWQKAQQHVLHQRYGLAQSIYSELTKRHGGVAQLWFEQGIVAMGELDFALADRSFCRTMELAPKDVSMLILLGQQYQRLRQMDRVRDCFERAVMANPSSRQALLSLAAWHEKERRLDDAWECIQRCVDRFPLDSQTLCAKALLLRRQDRNPEAELLLRDALKRDAPDATTRCAIRHLLAVVLDELGQHAEAFKWLTESKSHSRQTANTAQLERDYDQAVRRRRELLAALTSEMIQRWRNEGPASPCRYQPAFLGGHPRSGTTLLEQILGAHPGVLAFDEPEAFPNEIWNRLDPVVSTRPLTLKELDSLPVNRQAELRQRYLKSLLREVEGEPEMRVLLDKNPSPTMALPLWLRIFPELKALIALRDPRDVVISCFFQNLPVMGPNVNFLSLERTVQHYRDLMDVWLRLRELGGFDWIEVRYEAVVNDLEGEGRRATQFVGLDWHEEQNKYRETARKKFIFAPTYSDVAQPLHKRAVERWRKYAEALEPHQQQLAPYCQAFGYSIG
jgi:tetratricopeptide (TPR) repeat protein